MNIPLRIVCIAVAGMAASALHAHHASNLIYDAESIGTVEGIVEDVFWANPHIHVYLAVMSEDGSSETWDMEGPNLVSMRRQGVSEDMIRIGDEIRVTGTLGRDGTKRIWANSIMKSDGTVVMGGE